jgi:ribose transport system substrate-binding protein
MGAWRRGRVLCAAVAVAAAAAITAGCGSSSSSGGSGSASSSGGASSAAASGASSSGKKLTIAYVSYSLQAANQQYLNKGFIAEAKKYGYATKTVDSGGDVGKANQLMQTLITQKVNAIVFDSYGTKAMQAGVLAAKAAHIPVYAAYNWGPPVNVAASIQAAAAKQETNAMLSGMGNKGSVLAFTLPAGANCVNGVSTFKTIMAAHPGVKVTYHATVAPGWQVDANNATAAWLKSNPTPPLAVWGCWDGPSVGATAAIAAAGKTKDVKVYGDYGEADAINAIKAGKYTATWYFDGITLGQKIVQLMHANANTPYDQIKGQFVQLSPIEVNQANVSQFIKAHPESVAGS